MNKRRASDNTLFPDGIAEACGACIFAQTYWPLSGITEEDKRILLCCRKTPSIDTAGMAIWPQVNDSNWCAEGRPLPTEDRIFYDTDFDVCHCPLLSDEARTALRQFCDKRMRIKTVMHICQSGQMQRDYGASAFDEQIVRTGLDNMIAQLRRDQD